ncbi:ROK family protein [Oerskovia flava]|uniref:ROK family protein n=1 Tax=Oerskovia flava TaxID=2986422 RepID=UPI00223F266F|nr:ROK family protein [Oerskovia sp. JB1-3-2]
MNRTPVSLAARQGTLREHNLALVARAVFESPAPRSRADLSVVTGLTRATVSVLVDQLVDAEILRELPPLAPQRAGRPAVPLTPAARSIVGLGLEVNVDYLGGRVVDLTGAVVAERVTPGDFHASDPADVLARLGTLARDLLAEVDAQGMRVAGARLALPGLVDARAGRLQVAPNLGWSELDPVPLLGLDPGLRFDVANEAKLAGLAQSALAHGGPPVPSDPAPGAPPLPDDGARPGPSSYLYVSGDVGIGSAIVIDRQLFLGRHGWSGEIGHVVVDPHGPRCPCGATGCLEQYAGKDALLRAAGLGVDAQVADLVAALDAGDARATAAAARAGSALGSALADFMNLVDIDTVLLGGIYPDLLPYLRAPLLTGLRTRVLAAPWAEFEVSAALVGSYAAMTGGARLVLRDVLAHPADWVTPV